MSMYSNCKCFYFYFLIVHFSCIRFVSNSDGQTCGVIVANSWHLSAFVTGSSHRQLCRRINNTTFYISFITTQITHFWQISCRRQSSRRRVLVSHDVTPCYFRYRFSCRRLWQFLEAGSQSADNGDDDNSEWKYQVQDKSWTTFSWQ